MLKIIFAIICVVATVWIVAADVRLKAEMAMIESMNENH